MSSALALVCMVVLVASSYKFVTSSKNQKLLSLSQNISKIINLGFVRLFASILVLASTTMSISNLPAFADATTTTPGITIVKLFDGSAPFDAAAGNGNDTGNANDIVRAGQVTAYKFDLSLNDPNAGTPTPYTNFKFVSDPLPLGFRWQSLPLLCAGAGSAITGDGITTQSILTCNTGTKNTGDVFSVQAAVFTLPTVVNNTVLSFGATASVTGSTNTATSPAPEVVATVLPKIDVQKSGAQFFGSKNLNGVDGFVYAHGLGIKLKPGSEIPTLPLTLTDDVSTINPNAKFVGCGVSGTQSSVLGGSWVYSLNMPLGKTGQYSAWDNNVNNSVKDSGTISCPTQSGNDQLANISISGVDAMASTFPSQLFPYYSPVSPGDNWIGSYYTLVWIPATEFNSGNSYNFVGTNKYNDFNPTGAISGAQNFNDFSLEPGRGIDNNATASQTALTNTENWYTQIYYRPGPGSFEKYDYRFQDSISTATFFGDTANGSIWGAYVGSNLKSGDGVMGTNGSYTSLLVNYYNGVIDIPAGFISCSTIDTSKVSIAPLPGHPTRGAFNFSYGPQDSNSMHGIAVEYGIGGAGGAGTGWASTNDMKTSTCDDNDSTGGIWYNDITTVPGGIDKITKVRFRLTDTWTVAEQLALMATTGVPNVYSYGAVHLKVKSTANAGDVAPNYGKFKDPSGNWFSGWYQSAYDSTTGLGAYGDRITVVGTRVRVAKTINDPITESQVGLAGSTKTFYLTSTSDAMGITPAGDSVNVKIVDTVPSGLSYSVGTSVCIDALPAIQPTSCQPNVVVNGNGTTTLTWDFGTFTAGSAITKIKYDVTVDSTVADGVSLINTATISADNDNSLEAWRTDTATATVINPSAFAVQKKVLTPLVPIGDQIVYRLIAKNTGAVTVNNTDFIDWLPWNGDSRTPASNFSGNMNFVSLSNISGVPATFIEYTKYDRSTLSLPADLDPQTINSSIVWCSALSGGACPSSNSEVTGFRFKTGTMNSGEGTEFELIIKPDANALDSTGNIITNRFKGRVDGLTLPIESNNVFATVVGGTIGDTIYWDKSGNGLLDAGEAGIPGVTVKLVDPITGDPIDCDNATAGVQPCSAVTDANGKYKFENLKFGNYKVVVTPPAGYTQTGDNDTTLDNSTVLTVDNSSTASRTNLNGDFGYKGTGSWGDQVWYDNNGNQIQDSGSGDANNLPGAKVTLEFAGFDGIFGTADDVTFPQATTDNQGNYTINDLPPGNYRSTLDLSSVNGVLTTPAVVTHTLTPSESYLDADYGIKFSGTIGDTVYWDLNSNNIQDTNEKGIAGVTVTLKNDQGADIDCAVSSSWITTFINLVTFTVQANAAAPCVTTTGPDGKYKFENLPFGTYTVVVSQPAGFSTQTQDPDSTVDNSTLLTINTANPSNLTGDFGYVGNGSFGDKVFYDLNGDGIQDPTDTIGVVGAQVTLTEAGLDGIFGNGDDVTVGTKTVDSTGNYLFSNLPAGKYKADIVTSSLNGATLTTPASVTQTLTSGQNYIAGDFGINGVTSISGYNYVDTNNNGIKDAGETPIQGTLVTLTGGTLTTPLTTNTLSDGSYSFPNIAPGTYTVTMAQSPLYFDGKDTASTALTTNGTVAQDDKVTSIVLAPGNVSTNNNFGELPKSTITGSIYFDDNNNGAQDPTDPSPQVTLPLPVGTTVTITDTTNPLVTFTTTVNLDGTYSQDLPAGAYTVTVNVPASSGYVITPSTQTGDGTGSNPTTVTVGIGETKSQGKDGLYQAPVGSTISGYNYVDTNNDGIKDAGETPIAGTLVTLTGGTLTTPLTTNTLADGSYSFPNLAPGTYTVTMAQPSTYLDGKDTASTALATNGSVAQDDKVTNIALTAGEVSTNNNFGELPLPATATITGSIYLNPDNNGTQDAGEPNPSATAPLPAGTTITITSTTDPLVTFTVAINPDGTYSQVVPAGTYTVTVNPPAGYSVSPSTELGDGTGSNPTTVTVLAGQTKSQGKDGLYMTPVVTSSSVTSSVVSSIVSSSIANSSETTSSETTASSSATNSSETTISSVTTSSVPASSVTSSETTSSVTTSSEATTNSSSAVATSSAPATNNTPSATNDAYQTGINTPIALTPLNGDMDPNNSPLKIKSINGTTLNNTPSTTQTITVPNGTVVVVYGPTGSVLSVTFNPTTGYTGTTSFPYVIENATGQTANATETITIMGPVNTSSTNTNSSSNNSSVTTISSAVTNVDLGILKQGDKVKTAVGDTLTYTMLINNNSNVAVSGAILKDSLPTGFTVNSITCSATAGSTCPATSNLTGANIASTSGIVIPTLGANSSITVVITGTVTTIVQLINSASITVPQGYSDTNPTNNVSEFPTVFDPPSGKKIGTFLGQNIVEWQQVWINEKGISAQQATITDNIPAGTTYVPNTLQCEARGVSITTSCTYNTSNDSTTWVGTIGADYNNFTEATANNEVVIKFQILIPADMNEVSNQSEICSELGCRKSDDPATNLTPGDTTRVRRQGTASIGAPTRTITTPSTQPVSTPKPAVTPAPTEAPKTPESIVLPKTGGSPAIEKDEAKPIVKVDNSDGLSLTLPRTGGQEIVNVSLPIFMIIIGMIMALTAVSDLKKSKE
jgi:uncharacterized repeat protein (TIGR01451 family)